MILDVDPQRRAADPTLSVFVTANAGSGKTKTLIDRVARLLLAGAEPETILCVTYTKAAAAEMQRRLFGRLGEWSVCSDDRLRGELAGLEGLEAGGYDQRRLSAARALFARALETPGGLKIQTIHAFCEKLLRRFPLEAGVSPGFKVMDDTAAAAVAEAAKRDVAHYAMAGDGLVADAYARFSVALDFASFQAMFAGFAARRGALAAFLEREGGLSGARTWAWAKCGFGAEADPDRLAAEAEAELDPDLWLGAAEVLGLGGVSDQKCGQALRAAAEPGAGLDAALSALFTESGEGTPKTWVAKTSALRNHEGLRQRLLAEQARLEAAREGVRAARVASDTVYALVLADAYLTAYRIEKQQVGALDFDDLIEKTRGLLRSRPAAAWVLYKLDGGVDHILVDEAQDTAPDQWRIIRALTGEFFAGEGAERFGGERNRNMFVVGDEKQSIYSFQGAQPELLIEEFHHHRAQALAAGHLFERVELHASWRSTPEVLAFVDAAFSPPERARAVTPRAAGRDEEREPIAHTATRQGHHGCVDLWPLVKETPGETREAWDAPLDVEGEASANRRLAENIACEIAELTARGDAVFDRETGAWRPASFGDVLILVRKRGALFEEILRALKHAKIPVGGADRLALSQHIVFDDLIALARFALFPSDDLTLAALLRSPFCDLDDEGLYALAKGRTGSLWETLVARGDDEPAWRGALGFLRQAREEAASRPPFEFYARMLGLSDAAGRSMRQRLLRRLGAEAQDALDEFLAQVLAAEGRGVRDLESLAQAFASLDIMVKREMEAGRDEVRVMTAHGAKGLEAPIVFLPETTSQGAARGSPLMATEDGGFLWCSAKTGDCEASRAARDLRARKEAEEADRLLYVALTRARERLVLCGRIAANRNEETLKGWWGAIRAGFEHDAVKPHLREAGCGKVTAIRFGPDPQALGARARSSAGAGALPAWTRAVAAPEAFARLASPSNLGGDGHGQAPSPLAAVAGLGRFRRGDLIHRLLQILPDISPRDRQAAARSLLARERDLTREQRAEMTAAALSVLENVRFAQVFGAGSRAEVAIAGQARGLPAGVAISGRIDRLVVLPDRVLVVDFKTNRPSPAAIGEADPAYLRQMAAYAAVLGEVFPDRPIEAALVWTDGPKLMPVPENVLAEALAQLNREG